MQFDPLGSRKKGGAASSSSRRPALTSEVTKLQEDLASLVSEWSSGEGQPCLLDFLAPTYDVFWTLHDWRLCCAEMQPQGISWMLSFVHALHQVVRALCA